jgi:hypothetical protein
MQLKTANALRVAFWATAGLAILVALGTLLLPIPDSWEQSQLLYHIQLIIAVFLPTLHILAAIYILQGLQGFKPELHHSYRLIAYGIILIGFALMQSAIVSIFVLWDSWWLTSGLITLPYIIAMAIIYRGSRTFYSTLGIRSLWRSFWPGIMLVLTPVVIIVILPHRPQPFDEWMFDLGQAMFVLTASFSLLVALTLGAVIRYVSPAYGRVLKWLVAGICIEVIIIGSSAPARLLALNIQETFGFLQNLLIFAGIPYFVAGYLFYQLTADTRSVAHRQSATAIDVVLYTASLVSSPQYIQPVLDEVRVVTASLKPGQPLTDDDQMKLANTYLELEAYLVKWERLRTFSADQLRDMTYQKFQNPTISQAFWQTILLASKPQPANG